uniref:DNA polymerase n=1 Tax=Bacillus subtilis TaxID=1423 RepID=UPI0011A39FA3
DIMKKGMIEMGAKVKEKKLKGRLLLEVEDELIFEGGKEEIEIVEKVVGEVMEDGVVFIGDDVNELKERVTDFMNGKTGIEGCFEGSKENGREV